MHRLRVGSNPVTVGGRPCAFSLVLPSLGGGCSVRSVARALSAGATAESEILLSDNLYWNLAGGRVNSELTIVLNAEHTFSSFCLLRKRCKLIRRHTDPGK